MFKGGQTVVFQPRWSFSFILRHFDFEAILLFLQQMKQFELFSAVKDVGDCELLFCSALQFNVLYKFLIGETENVVILEDMLEVKEARGEFSNIFELDFKSLCMCNLQWSIIMTRKRNICCRVMVFERPADFPRKEQPPGEMWSTVDCLIIQSNSS